MRNLIILGIICVIGWQASTRYEAKRASAAPAADKM